jgi:hypothetical protein
MVVRSLVPLDRASPDRVPDVAGIQPSIASATNSCRLRFLSKQRMAAVGLSSVAAGSQKSVALRAG